MRTVYTLFKDASWYIVLWFLWIIFPLDADNVINNLCKVDAKLLKKEIVGLGKNGRQTTATDIVDLFLSKLVMFSILGSKLSRGKGF